MTGFDRFNTKNTTENKAAESTAGQTTGTPDSTFPASPQTNPALRRQNILQRVQRQTRGEQTEQPEKAQKFNIEGDPIATKAVPKPQMDTITERTIKREHSAIKTPPSVVRQEKIPQNTQANSTATAATTKQTIGNAESQASKDAANNAILASMAESKIQLPNNPVSPAPAQSPQTQNPQAQSPAPTPAQSAQAQAMQAQAQAMQAQAMQAQAQAMQAQAQSVQPPSPEPAQAQAQDPLLQTNKKASAPEQPKKQGLLSRLFGGGGKKPQGGAPGPAGGAMGALGGGPGGAPGGAPIQSNAQMPGGPSDPAEARWDIKPSFTNKDDPLLGCLMILCKLLDRSTTEEALMAELPVDNEPLTPELFIRSAEREDIASKLVNRKLSSISNLVLPCVVLLKGKRAAVLTELKYGKEATLIMPDSKEGENVLKWKELEDNYTGYSIFSRPQFRYDKRASDMQFIKKPRGWFWGTVFNLWPIYVEVIIASFIVNILMVIGPLFMMNVYDRVIPHFAFETLWVLAIGVGILLVFQFTIMVIRSYMIELAGKAVHTRISSRLFQQLMGLKMGERGDSTGKMAEKVSGIDNVRQFFTSQTALSVIDLPFSAMFLSIIYVMAGPIALVPTSIIVFLLLAATCMGPVIRRFTRQQQEEKQHGRAIMVETIYGMETIKSTGAESRLQKDWELFNEKNSATQMSSQSSNQIVMSLMMVSMQLNMVLIALFGVYMIKEGSLTMGGLLAANMLSMRAISPMMRVAGVAMRLHQSVLSLKQIQEIMEKEVERPLGSNFVHRSKFQGSIEFKNVSFTYPDQETKALDNVSFKVNPGEKIGVIGRIGSGKSTIERLMLGLYEVDEGAVLIDGIDTRQIDPAELRRNIGTVPQDVFLFYGTLKENISLHAPYADDDMILRAAHIAGVDEFVARHPQGMELQVGERGQNLSGGQRQAVSVARAFLIDPPMMLLDEPTAAMDTTSENRFKARLGNLMGNRTLILMTHRFSLLSIIDRLLVVDNSKIVADGPKDRVLEALRNGTIQSVDV